MEAAVNKVGLKMYLEDDHHLITSRKMKEWGWATISHNKK